MRSLFIFLFFSLLASPFFAQKFSFEKPRHDFGKLAYDSECQTTFHFTNVGTDTLIIKKAKTSCGCTVVELAKDRLAPGESSSFQVGYDTKRVGRFSKFVILQSNDIDEPIKRIYIGGEVLPKVEAPPLIGPPRNPEEVDSRGEK